MSTPIEIVREMQLWRRAQGKYGLDDYPPGMPFSPRQYGVAIDAVLRDAERFAALEAQNARMREALEGLQSDAQCTLDLYNKNGPTWTSRDSGEEYYSASYVIDSTEERIATIKAALTDTKGTP